MPESLLGAESQTGLKVSSASLADGIFLWIAESLNHGRKDEGPDCDRTAKEPKGDQFHCSFEDRAKHRTLRVSDMFMFVRCMFRVKQ
ncbi:hypothetical protein MAE02_12750 [Microvirga aerophila]|uniref:Uncharacterized protein n=1 Tax=Microvirga aerophila TaxID=670291 RepID=A0A512BNP6_9HYPH|nr:hypothetical protein MAE02_12750 [Microvirga aerophila]